MQQGDVLSGSISLSASDFIVTNNEPHGLVMGAITIGSDFPTTLTPGSSATGAGLPGLPIVIQIGLDFSAGQLLDPGVALASTRATSS